MSLPLTPFGRTHMQVSRLGLGLAALGRPGYINLGHSHDLQQGYNVADMQARTHQVLDAAWQAGIRYFDAARSYGLSEAFLGSWLHSKNIKSGSVAVGSKWGYTYTANWQVEAEKHEVKDHSLPILARQWAESHQLIGPWLGLYQVHSATLESGILTNTAVLNKLVKLKEQGVAIGLSLSGAQQAKVLEQAMTIRPDGELLWDAAQATWNVLETSAQPALQAAHKEGVAIILKEALANGRLTARNTAPGAAALLNTMKDIASQAGTTMPSVALAYALEQPWVTIVLSGASTIQQLNENVQALHVQLTSAQHDQLKSLAQPPALYWEQRSQLPWN